MTIDKCSTYLSTYLLAALLRFPIRVQAVIVIQATGKRLEARYV